MEVRELVNTVHRELESMPSGATHSARGSDVDYGNAEATSMRCHTRSSLSSESTTRFTSSIRAPGEIDPHGMRDALDNSLSGLQADHNSLAQGLELILQDRI